MASARLILRTTRGPAFTQNLRRPFSSVPSRLANLNDRANDTAETHRKKQTEKPLNPHMTNTTSTIANEMPSVGKDKVPPELITSVDPDYTPADSVPENTERMTGGTQAGKPASGANAELDVGEIEGGKFRIEPLKRTGEDERTLRQRLLYQSRKRGTLESDLLLSTFADTNLGRMTVQQMQEYDRFLDENDWDIYYWATQEPSPTSQETAEGGEKGTMATEAVAGKDEQKREPAKGEWAQTIGTFKPAYRPVPKRWQDSEILKSLRSHVAQKSAGGVDGREQHTGGEGLSGSALGAGGSGGGLGRMPDVKNFD